MATDRRPILVTGSHRSGTTWIGKMIALSKEVQYIFEPFAKHSHYKMTIEQMEYLWFLYLNDENDSKYYQKINDIIEFNIRSIKLTNNRKSKLMDFLIYLWDCNSFIKASIKNKIPLLKDPIAIFSAEWLSKRFNTKNIVMIRNPLAVISSIKRLGFNHPFDHFLMQPLLIENYSTFYKTQIKEYSINKPDIIDDAILLWNLIYSKINNYQNDHPDWLFIKHEDISKEPQIYFRKIYDYLGLNFTKKIDRKIREHSKETNPIEVEPGNFHINSKMNIYNWQNRLTQVEIKKIIEGTKEVSKFFYNDNEMEKII